MSGESWTHKAVRPLVRPLIGTPIRPNHLTTLRLLTGLGAGLCLAWNSVWWAGTLWLVSALLDRADGELARLGRLSSPSGHLFDYYVDNLVNALFFACAGFGLRHTWLGGWAIGLGFISAAALFICGILSERLEQESPPDTKAYEGRWGFDPDDALYLLAPLTWLGWLDHILIAAAVVSTVMMTLTAIRLQRLPARA